MRLCKLLAPVLAWGAFSCGGQTAPVSHPPEPPKRSEPSGLSIRIDADNAYEAKGDAFAEYDPDQQMLAVFVFAPDSLPKPSCEELSVASLNLSAGGFAAIRMRGFTSKTAGTVPITGGGFIAGNVKAHETRMASSGPEASNLVIATYDDSHLVAHVESDAKAEMQIHGSFDAVVCPDGALGAAGQAPKFDPSEFDAGPPEDATPPPKPKSKKKKRRH